METEPVVLNSSWPSTRFIRSSQHPSTSLWFSSERSSPLWQGGGWVVMSHFCTSVEKVMLSTCSMQKCILMVKLVEPSSTNIDSKRADIFLKRCMLISQDKYRDFF